MTRPAGWFVIVCSLGIALASCAVPAGKSGTTSASQEVELLRDGDFDDGGGAAWVEDSAGGFPIINGPGRLPLAAHSGGDAAWLGGYADADDSLTQDVAVPDGATGAVLTFFLWVRTDRGPASAAGDLLVVALQDEQGTVLQQVAVFSNRDSREAWRPCRFDLADASALAGTTVRLVFRGLLDSAVLTSFFVDTVSLVASVTPAAS